IGASRCRQRLPRLPEPVQVAARQAGQSDFSDAGRESGKRLPPGDGAAGGGSDREGIQVGGGKPVHPESARARAPDPGAIAGGSIAAAADRNVINRIANKGRQVECPGPSSWTNSRRPRTARAPLEPRVRPKKICLANLSTSI